MGTVVLIVLVVVAAVAVIWSTAAQKERKRASKRMDAVASGQVIRVGATLPARKPSGFVRLRGGGGYKFEVVGESFYQDALRTLASDDLDETGVEMECQATLRFEPENPHDKNAVAVIIGGHKVASLSRAQAVEYGERMKERGLYGSPATCRAVICGGWDFGGGDKGHFGVKLDIAWPVRPF